ncbi:MAG: MscL family protein [bacterium]|nr:MscL family protein [bacterium]
MTKKTSKNSDKTRAQKLSGRGKDHANGFIGFVREQGVVGLAVGLAVGTAASSAVKTIVDEFLNPIIGFIIGGVDLTKLKLVIVGPGPDGVGGLSLGWGAILSAIITLLATAYLIYWLVHVARLDRLDKAK